jgi:hypothetical protein
VSSTGLSVSETTLGEICEHIFPITFATHAREILVVLFTAFNSLQSQCSLSKPIRQHSSINRKKMLPRDLSNCTMSVAKWGPLDHRQAKAGAHCAR